MKDSTISARLPISLIKELKKIAIKKHYMDVSEQVREIIREKNKEHLSILKKASNSNISLEKTSKSNYEEKAQLIFQLQKIIDQLNNMKED